MSMSRGLNRSACIYFPVVNTCAKEEQNTANLPGIRPVATAAAAAAGLDEEVRGGNGCR
jgi:hypothetical protein